MNQLALIGRIVRDVEVRRTAEGRHVLNNTLAVQRRFKTDSGPQTDFIPFTVWGKTAELMSKYCQKGHLIGLSGRIQSRSYLDKHNETVYVVEMIADEVQFLQPKSEESYARMR